MFKWLSRGMGWVSVPVAFETVASSDGQRVHILALLQT